MRESARSRTHARSLQVTARIRIRSRRLTESDVARRFEIGSEARIERQLFRKVVEPCAFDGGVGIDRDEGGEIDLCGFFG